MPPLSDFDPTEAVQYWMHEKKRNPKTSQTSQQQEWFKGVFKEAKDREHKTSNTTITF